MKCTVLISSFLVLSFSLFYNSLLAQDWNMHVTNQSKLIEKISNNEDWKGIYDYAKDELILSEASLCDISKSIEFGSSNSDETIIDQFFHSICDSSYAIFPYRSSGRLSERHFFAETDTSYLARTFNIASGRDLHSHFAALVNIDEEVLIPKLIDYLSNDAATRLCIRPPDWDDPAFYISISDVAMDLIEVKTYCDFFDNASQGNKLFSNLKQEEKAKLINVIKDWYANSRGMTVTEKINLFLSTYCNYGYSYIFTCHNLLFTGDTIQAIKMYRTYYDSLSMPCRKEWKIGETLLTLGDRIVLHDCINTSTNYRCMVNSGMKCVEILLQSEYAYYRDEQLAEIVSTEPHSHYRNNKMSPKFIWHKILGELWNYSKYKLPKTLRALMKIKDDFSSLSSYMHGWKRKYPEELLNTYRVCDLALLKYGETIETLDDFNWELVSERDKMIATILKKHEK